MGAVRKTRRGVMLVEKQEWFVRLIGQGVSNSEACRIVGVNRRTGTRWRYGRTIRNTAGEPVHYPPVTFTAPKAERPRYLSLAERTTIADLHRAGVSVCDIAHELGRAASTVSRELRRNADGRGRYLPATAERLSVERQSRSSSRTRRVTRDVQLYGVVAELLGKRWSPEQIAHELRVRFPDQPERHLCTESLYQAIYDPRIALTRPAKQKRRRRRRRVQGLERRGRLTAMTMIADRPAEVADRVQIGHWEGDCLMGAGKPFGDRHSRRTRDPLCDPDPRAHRATERRGDARRHRRGTGCSGAPSAADADLGSGERTRAAPADHRRHRDTRVLL